MQELDPALILICFVLGFVTGHYIMPWLNEKLEDFYRKHKE